MAVRIASRSGNVLVGVLGVVFALSAVVELAVLLFQTAGASGLIDRAIQLLLIVVLAISIWFTRIAARALGWHLHLPAGRRSQAVSATSR
jgi:hypothetical protein